MVARPVDRLMRIILLCGLVTGQDTSQDIISPDQPPATIPVEIGVGPQAATGVDCTKAFECDLVPYAPVCGSDGVTYANNCVFASVFCSSEHNADTLFIQALGECPSSSEDQEGTLIEPLSEIESEIESSTKESSDVDLMTVFCSLRCKLTPDHVCGTDGVTYINDCHLLSSKCERPDLEKASHGDCVTSQSDINLNVLEVGVSVIDSPATAEKCNPMCDRVYDPICGSDGITYANLCLLEYAECRNPNVKVFGPGKCPPNMQAARTSNTLTSTYNGGESCIPEPCPYTYAPVCGSDGQTHDNLCLFANARCQQQALTVIHDGECDVDTQITCQTMTCPTFTECREQVEADNSVVAYCADVCSSDRCSERENCELVDSDCYTAPCSPIAMCVLKVQDG
ncbi:hypothetical protein PI124_g12437 [Phytophthora idaei]|nr:hypothetical protein PI125_g12028 [Phytophthora idaei]KAG3151041.1 hypothetical protein PI126_g11178 [Phytophthora idaei]KAG3242725.1 hypothetical protein PI124_g12437 [Phytophthora idaei]